MKLYSAIYDTGDYLFKDKTAPELFSLIPGGAKELTCKKPGESRFQLVSGRKITIFEEKEK